MKAWLWEDTKLYRVANQASSKHKAKPQPYMGRRGKVKKTKDRVGVRGGAVWVGKDGQPHFGDRCF